MKRLRQLCKCGGRPKILLNGRYDILSILQSDCLLVCFSVCQSFCLPFCLLVCLSIGLSIGLSVSHHALDMDFLLDEQRKRS